MNTRTKHFVPRRIDSFIGMRSLLNRKQILQKLSTECIRLNDHVVKDPSILVFQNDIIRVNNSPLPAPPPLLVFAFHKPGGFISAHRAVSPNKPTIGEFLERMGEGITHVGRLDRATTGLLLATNDGDLNHALTHPKSQTEKVYVLTLKGHLDEEDPNIRKLSTKIENNNLKKKVVYHAKSVRILKRNETSTCIEMTLTEGKKRQIRHMCAIVGLKLLHLHRVRVGPIELGDSRSGTFRTLSSYELQELYSPFGGKEGFAKERANRLVSQLEKDTFPPDVAKKVRQWKEYYFANPPKSVL